MSADDDEITCGEGSKGSSIGMALEGAGKKSNERAIADLSPIVGSTDSTPGTT